MNDKWARLILISLLILGLSVLVSGEDSRKIAAVKISSEIKIDGDLSDEAWKNIESIRDFIQFSPHHGEPSFLNTEVKIAYDSSSIYFAFYCADPDAGNISASVTTFSGSLSSNVIVLLCLGNNPVKILAALALVHEVTVYAF